MKRRVFVSAGLLALVLAACAGVTGEPIYTDTRLPQGGLGVSISVRDAGRGERTGEERAALADFSRRLDSELQDLLGLGGFAVLPEGAPKAHAKLVVTLRGPTGAAGTPEGVRALLSGEGGKAEATSTPWKFYKDALFKDESKLRGGLAAAVATELANQLLNAPATRDLAARAEEHRLIERARRYHEPVRAPAEAAGPALAVFEFRAEDGHASEFAGAMQTLILYELIERKCVTPREVDLAPSKAKLCKDDACLRAAAKLAPGEALLAGSYEGKGATRNLHLRALGPSEALHEADVALPAGEAEHRIERAADTLAGALGCD